VRRTLSYEEEAWAMTSEGINTLRIFERDVVRKTYGTIKEEEI
jgi:hypothetical protein